VGPRCGLVALERRKTSFPYQESNHYPSVVESVAWILSIVTSKINGSRND
jgi:hypothetical protein